MLQPLLQNKLNEIRALCEKHKVISLYAFGSVCTDRFSDSSDIDLLVNFDMSAEPIERGELYWKLLQDLEKILGREVDLLTEQSLSNPYFIEEMNEKKMPLYGKAA